MPGEVNDVYQDEVIFEPSPERGGGVYERKGGEPFTNKHVFVGIQNVTFLRVCPSRSKSTTN